MHNFLSYSENYNSKYTNVIYARELLKKTQDDSKSSK